MDWEEFKQVAQKVAQEEGYPVAVLLGQAAQETGRNVSSAPGYNFFGIKGPGQTLKTWEDYGNGPVTVMANFRAYNSPEDSIRDYINLIKNNYPQAWALRDNPTAMIQAIKAGGYATDPNYVNAVTNTPEFKQFAQAPQPTQPIQPQQSITQPEKPKTFMELLKDYLVPQAHADFSPTNPGGLQNASYGGYKPSAINYTVKPGDTLWGIAEQYGLGGNNYKQIQGYSGQPTQLPVGQSLKIPKPGGSVSYTQPANKPAGPGASAPNYSPSTGGAAYAPPSASVARAQTQAALPTGQYITQPQPNKTATQAKATLGSALPLGRFI